MANRRYFGKGDVLRNASLEFDSGAFVEIESLFEQCSISLGKGTELVVGKGGVLSDCQIRGRRKHHHQRSFLREPEPGHRRSRAGRRERGRRSRRRSGATRSFDPFRVRAGLQASNERFYNAKKTNGEGRRD